MVDFRQARQSYMCTGPAATDPLLPCSILKNPGNTVFTSHGSPYLIGPQIVLMHDFYCRAHLDIVVTVHCVFILKVRILHDSI
jgi:hypothetical protein